MQAPPGPSIIPGCILLALELLNMASNSTGDKRDWGQLSAQLINSGVNLLLDLASAQSLYASAQAYMPKYFEITLESDGADTFLATMSSHHRPTLFKTRISLRLLETQTRQQVPKNCCEEFVRHGIRTS